MATDYPVTITDESGVERLIGSADFTDPANAPGGSLPFKPATGDDLAILKDSTGAHTLIGGGDDSAGAYLEAADGSSKVIAAEGAAAVQALVTGAQASLVPFVGGGVVVTDDGAGHSEIGLYGADPVAQAGALTAVVTTTPALTSYGFTLAQAEAIIANLNAVTAALTALGVLAA